MRTRAMALSLMLTRSTPASWRRRAASIVRSMRTERGGSISTLIDEAAVGEQLAPGGWAAAARVGAAAAARSTMVARGAPAPSGGSAHGVPRAAPRDAPCQPARSMSSAWRMAAMCSGVVPQQPPTIRAPGVQEARHRLGEVRRPGGVDELALDARRQAGVGHDRARRPVGSAPICVERVEADLGPDAAVDADGVDAGARSALSPRIAGVVPSMATQLLAEGHRGEDRQVAERRAPPRRRSAARRGR